MSINISLGRVIHNDDKNALTGFMIIPSAYFTNSGDNALSTLLQVADL
jgi:hypothetical protein